MRGKNKKNEKVNKVEKAVKKVTDPIENWIDNVDDKSL